MPANGFHSGWPSTSSSQWRFTAGFSLVPPRFPSTLMATSARPSVHWVEKRKEPLVTFLVGVTHSLPQDPVGTPLTTDPAKVWPLAFVRW